MLELACEALDNMDPADLEPRDIINMIRVANDQLRKDYESEAAIYAAEQAEQGGGIDWHGEAQALLAELVNVDPVQLSQRYREILKDSERTYH